MPRRPRLPLTAPIICLLALIGLVTGATDAAMAQEDIAQEDIPQEPIAQEELAPEELAPEEMAEEEPSPAESAAETDTTLAEGEAVITGRIRHTHHFGLALRGSYFAPIYILKENRRNINDITTSDFGYDYGLRWYVIDDLVLLVRGTQAGLKFKTNEKNLGLFDFSGNEVIEFSGIEAGVIVYIGDVIMSNSRFNPYLTAAIGKVDWTLAQDGSGSDPVTILDEPVTGSDIGVGFGLGTEYPLSNRLVLELEWIWRYVLTEDELLWPDPTTLWTNTHYWAMSFGLVANF